MKNIKNIFLASFAFLLLSTTTFANFSDVNDSEFYQEAIEFLAENKIINGYDDGTFKPNNEVNRAEMLKIVLEAKGINETELNAYQNESCFEDVPANVWFTKYVCYSKTQSYINGYENGRFFRPETSINFVEAIKIILKIFEIEYELDEEIWYRGIVNSASEDNYIPFNIVAFDTMMNRAQMADLVTRILKDLSGELDDYLGVRKMFKVTYHTITKAMAKESWDLDPNNNALISTFILTSVKDSNKVLTIAVAKNEDENDPSITESPLLKFYQSENFTFYYYTSAHCILENTCPAEALFKTDEIAMESLKTINSFGFNSLSIGNNGCIYLSKPMDFSLEFLTSWGDIDEHYILEQEHWGEMAREVNNPKFCTFGQYKDPAIPEDDGNKRTINSSSQSKPVIF